VISELCIFDLVTGSVKIVLRHDGHIEAPNWHPSGDLYVNGEGRLWRVPAGEARLEPVDTGFAVRLNNDHGLSPDGGWIAITDKVETGRAAIYRLPVAGGAPERIVEPVPSWWHGWAPDGEAICYAGVREGTRVTVLAKPLDAEEVCLATGFDHADGPDFSADGEWVWFNGELDGAVNLWRVRPDATGLERMTDEATVDWFPHPSPCGTHVLYLAYPHGTAGHPFGVEVGLRLMPQEGGLSRELVRLWGGQGTINVPSWAPDGRAFAFMRFVP
jgi:Tol biopolymer transport system component